MKVTGYKLQNAIRDWEMQRKIASGLFSNSLHAFDDDEDHVSPQMLMERFVEAENAIVQLQIAQVRYNLAVTVEVQDTTMTLAEAVKRQGGAGRREAMWRSAALDGVKMDRWDRERRLTRSSDEEHAQLTIGREEALELARKAARYASAVREGVKVGNATEVEIEGLDASLLV